MFSPSKNILNDTPDVRLIRVSLSYLYFFVESCPRKCYACIWNKWTNMLLYFSLAHTILNTTPDVFQLNEPLQYSQYSWQCKIILPYGGVIYDLENIIF